jgi:hypothetical protein
LGWEGYIRDALASKEAAVHQLDALLRGLNVPELDRHNALLVPLRCMDNGFNITTSGSGANVSHWQIMTYVVDNDLADGAALAALCADVVADLGDPHRVVVKLARLKEVLEDDDRRDLLADQPRLLLVRPLEQPAPWARS